MSHDSLVIRVATELGKYGRFYDRAALDSVGESARRRFCKPSPNAACRAFAIARSISPQRALE